ncbi:MAG: nickel pincer cofactor biosynthesis protein LarB [Oscillatoriales cyanobacterium C42_A2020_001]|nr:nickel pincer cofactor biosynthesis protein LarB [Leptolyngbyaceae cyanobacterium C42_A2020_001]
MTQPEAIRHLLNAVAQGEVSPETALDKLKYLTYEPVEDFARIDHHRALRTGFPEVIWGPGKTPDQIARIMEVMRHKTPVVMATRIEPAVYEQLQERVSGLHYYPLARICAVQGRNETSQPYPSAPSHPGLIGVLSAGTADLPVAEEAAITAELSGFQVKRLWDVGVAGIHRLLSHREAIAEADVLIVAAGMEGALPSVVAGLADCPVIAVPTSIGYGASFNGLAALLSMLNSCAAGVGVVNIDNGFGAAILAGQILRTTARLSTR